MFNSYRQVESKSSQIRESILSLFLPRKGRSRTVLVDFYLSIYREFIALLMMDFSNHEGIWRRDYLNCNDLSSIFCILRCPL